MELSAIRAIVFDFGGVFTRSDISQTQLRCYDETLGLPADTLHNCLFAGEAWELRSTGQLTADAYWQRVGQPYEDRLPAEFRRFRDGMFWAEPINEETVVLAQRLHRSYPLAICSNALPELTAIIAGRSDLQVLFDVRVISVAVGLRKPDPAIFRLTAERLNLPLESCLLVDDKPRNIRAAQTVGMPGLVFASAEGLEADLVALGVLPPSF